MAKQLSISIVSQHPNGMTHLKRVVLTRRSDKDCLAIAKALDQGPAGYHASSYVKAGYQGLGRKVPLEVISQAKISDGCINGCNVDVMAYNGLTKIAQELQNPNARFEAFIDLG